MKKNLLLVVIVILAQQLMAQNVAINNDGSTPNASALLDVKSTTKGVLLPRMTKTEKNAIASPVPGLLVYQTGPDSSGYYSYNGTRWSWILQDKSSDSVYWRTKGNTGNVDSITFLGNIDDVPVNFRVNNLRVGRFDRLRANYAIGAGAGGTTAAQGHVAIGDSAGGQINNNYAGIYLGYRSGARTTGGNNSYVGPWAGENNTTGTGNTFIGTVAGRSNTTGYYNSFIGMWSGYSEKIGAGNTALGFQAFQYDTSSFLNVAIGYQSMELAMNSSDNTAVGSYTLQNHHINGGNVAIGESALNQDTSGYNNVAVGNGAIGSNQNGIYNTAVGDNAMGAAVNPNTNEAFGYYALNHIKNQYDAGYWNTAIGSQAMEFDTTGYATVAVGFRALRNAKKVSESVALGVGAMEYGDSTYSNVAVGRGAMFNFGSAHENTSVGYFSMSNKKTGFWNTAMGEYAMSDDTSGTGNTAIGVSALRTNRASIDNVAVGLNAGYNAGGVAGLNTYVGAYSGVGSVSPATGTQNAALGYRSLENVATNSSIVAVGAYAGNKLKSGGGQVAIGANALQNNPGSPQNTAIGYFALNADTLGYYNTAVGALSMLNNISGYANTAIGSASMYFNRDGSFNTAVGQAALYQHRTGVANTALGSNALQFDTSGNDNTALGVNALTYHARNGSNTATGRNSLFLDTTGIGNSAYGLASLASNRSGSYNSGFGYVADVGNGALTNATAIGAYSYVNQNNSLVLGSISGVNSAPADTKVGIGTTTPDSIFSVANKFMVNKNGEIQYADAVNNMMYMFKAPTSNTRMVIAHSPAFTNWGLQYDDNVDKFNFISSGVNAMTIDLGNRRVGIGLNNPSLQLELSTNSAGKPTSSTWNITSDARLKTIDGDYTKGLADILKLNTIMYHYSEGNAKNLPANEQGYGFLAQEVQKVYPEAVHAGADGYLSLDLHPIFVSYINAFKDQQKQIDAQAVVNESLKKKNAELEKKNEQLEKDILLIKAKLGIN